MLFGILGRPDFNGLSMNFDRPGSFGVSSENSAGNLTPAGADQSGQSQNLSLSNMEGNVFDLAASGAQAGNLKNNFVGIGNVFRRTFQRAIGPASHVFDQFLHGQILGLVRDDMLAVAQDSNAVGNAHDFIQPVGNVDNGDSLFLQFLNMFKKHLRVLDTENGGGLVEYNDFRIVFDCLCNLDHLLARNTQCSNERIGIDINTEAVHQLLGTRIHFFAFDKASLAENTIEEDIVCYGQVRNHV